MLMRQLTAGDGFQASNERMLTFGLGDAERVDALEVQWPSGLRQEYHDLAVDREWMLIEGSPRPFSWDASRQPGDR